MSQDVTHLARIATYLKGIRALLAAVVVIMITVHFVFPILGVLQ